MTFCGLTAVHRRLFTNDRVETKGGEIILSDSKNKEMIRIFFVQLIFSKKIWSKFQSTENSKQQDHQINQFQFSLIVKNIVLNLHIRSMSLNVTTRTSRMRFFYCAKATKQIHLYEKHKKLSNNVLM